MATYWKWLLFAVTSLLLTACGAGSESDFTLEPVQALSQGEVLGDPPKKAQLSDPAPAFGPSSPTGNRYGMILIDRTGSMSQRRSTGNTRCKDAILQARGAAMEFFSTRIGGTHLSVWTFTNTSVTKLTNGYVGTDAVLAALDGLDPNGCSGSTPLADAMCWAVDDMQALEPKPTLLHVATDGYENSSSGACSGPSGDFTIDGTWENKVYNKLKNANVKARIDFWMSPTALGKSQFSTQSACTTAAECEDKLFAALADQTGGEYRRVKDDDSAYPCMDPARCPAPISSTVGNIFSFSASNTASATVNTVNHSVYLSAGETIQVGTCNVAGASGSGDTYLRLDGLAGTQVAANDDACWLLSNLSYTVPPGASGTYRIRAGCYSSQSCSGTVAYTISGAFSYSAGYTASATTNTVNRGIYLRPGQSIQLGTCKVAGASGSGDTYLRLATSTGAQVASNDDSCGLLSHLSYSVSASTSSACQIRAGCYSNLSCSGTVAYTISDATQTCRALGCAEVGAMCGNISDGCGGTVYCGGCPTNYDCVSNSCEPTPTCTSSVEPCPL